MDQKNGGSSKRFFLVLFFSKNQFFKSGFQKKIECPEFYFTSWIFVKKNFWYQSSRIRAVSGPYQAQNLKFHIFSFCFIHDGFHFWF
jgi:hypothetical protein